jgi:hypothetical protein
MSLVEPSAVAHSPTLRPLAVIFSTVVYLVDEVTLTVSVTVLGTVVVALGVAVLVEVGLRERSKEKPCTVIVEPDTAVTLPEAKALLVGTVTPVRTGNEPEGNERFGNERFGNVPPPGTVPPKPPPALPMRVQVPLDVDEMLMVVASTLPPEPLVPDAVTHTPTLTSLRLTETVAVIVVEEEMSTVD